MSDVMALRLMVQQAQKARTSSLKIEERVKLLTDATEDAFLNVGALCEDSADSPDVLTGDWGENQDFPEWLGSIWLSLIGEVPSAVLKELPTKFTAWQREFENYGLEAESFSEAAKQAKQLSSKRRHDDDQDNTAEKTSNTAAAADEKIPTTTAPPAKKKRAPSTGGTPTTTTKSKKDVKIRLRQDNPKRKGSKSFERYERYKAATSKSEYHALGGSGADYNHDLAHNFITQLDDDAVAGGTTSEEAPAADVAPGQPKDDLNNNDKPASSSA